MPVRVRSLEASEDEIQRGIVQALQLLGYVVLVTTRRVRLCPHCGKRPRGDDRASKGIPDLLVTRPGWGLRFVGLECKSRVGRPTPEQRALLEAGHVVLVRSVEEALAAVGEKRRIVGGVLA